MGQKSVFDKIRGLLSIAGGLRVVVLEFEKLMIVAAWKNWCKRQNSKKNLCKN
jgi:hypothetical protein